MAKGELVEALSPDGAAVLNLDDPLVAAMAEPHARPASWTFGHAAAAAVRLGDVEVDDLGRASFDLTHRGRPSTSPCGCSASTRRSTPPPPRRRHWRPGSRCDASPTSLRAIDRLSPMADGAARARRRPRRHQRRLQRQPGLDAVRAGDPRPDGQLRQADGRGAGGDARAGRHRRGGAPAGRAAPRAAGHRRGRGRRGGRPRGVRRPRRRRGDGTPRRATSRPPPRPGSGCARMWPVPTSYSSRRRVRGGSRRWPTCSWATRSNDVAERGKGSVR